MAPRLGSFVLPTPSKTSQLTNDAQFMSIHEYVLNASVLRGTTSLQISDISAGVIINRIELNVTTAFVSDVEQNNISVVGANSSVLMDATWNDPNTAGSYSTDCNYVVTSTITVNHDLSNMTAGVAILRIYAHDVVNE